MKNTFLFVLLFILSNSCYAQNNKTITVQIEENIRSLKKLNGRNKLKKTIELTELLMEVDMKRAQYYAQKSLDLSITLKKPYEKEKSTFLLGVINYHRKGLSNGYLEELQRSVHWFKKKHYYADYAIAKVFQGNIYTLRQSSDLVSEEMDQLISYVRTSGDDKALAYAYFGRMSLRNTFNKWEEDAPFIDSARFFAERIQDKSLLGRIRILSASPRIGWPDGRDSCHLSLKEAKSMGNRKLMLNCYQLLVTSFSAARKADSTYYYYQKSVEEARYLKDKYHVAINEYRIVIAHQYFQNYDSIIVRGKSVLPLVKQFGWTKREAFILKRIGHSWLQKGNNTKAINYINKSFKLSEQIGDEFSTYSSGRILSFLNIRSERFKESDEILDNLINWIEKEEYSLANERIKHTLYSQKGQSERKQKYYQSALRYFQYADSIAEKLPSGARLSNDIKLMDIFIDLGRVSESQDRLNYILAHTPESFYTKNEDFTFVKGRLMLALGKSDEAIKVFTDFLLFENLQEGTERRYKANIHLSELFAEKGQYIKALDHSKKAIEIRDKIDEEKDLLNLEKLQSKLDLAGKETQIAQLNNRQLRQENKLINQSNTLQTRRLYIIFLSIFLILAVIIFASIFKRIKDAKEKAVLQKASLEKENRIQEMRSRETKRIVELKNKLFANISHEFRTPLTLIQAPIETMMSTANEKDAETLKRVQHNTDQLLVMVDEMLELAKLEGGNVSLSYSNFDLDRFAHNVEASFLDVFNQKKIHFFVNVNEQGRTVKADKKRLRLVLNNLLKNAFHHTSENGKVELQLHIDGINNRLTIKVFNTGSQIAPELLTGVFDRYKRGSEENYTGYGIGLSLCKEIISLHEGSISATNNEGGVTFFLSIPTEINHVTPKTIRTFENLDANKKILQEDSQKKTVLIVEDNVQIRDLLEDLLQDNYTILCAENGLEGVETAKEKQPDIIISDIMMPLMNGNELVSCLKEELSTSHIPIVLLTAKSASEEKLEGLESGADDYLTKPFSPKELKVRVKNLLQQRELLRERFSKNVFLRPEDFTSNNLDQEFLTLATTIVNNSISNFDLTVEKFCRELALNRNSVHQKLKSLTGLSASQFIRSIKLKKAAECLLDDRISIIEISEMTGFNSRQAFNKAFKEQFEMTPSQYRKHHLSS